MKDTQFNKLFVFCCSLVPAVILAIDYLDGRTNQPEELLRITGICAFVFLALSLAVTPLRRLTGKNHWSLYRRMLGLYAFFYSLLHVTVYFFLKRSGSFSALLVDIQKTSYVFWGLLAFTLMIPLALTSTIWAIKKLGNKNWKRLHKLVYITAISACIHYFLTGKIVAAPLKLFFAILLGTLLLFRLIALIRDKYFTPAKPAPKPRPPIPAKAPA